MTIIKILEIANYINNYMNNREYINIKTFDFFIYNNFTRILANLLNAEYNNDYIYINTFRIYITNNNNETYEIYIIDNELNEPKGPI
jgi:hypothetical protein